MSNQFNSYAPQWDLQSLETHFGWKQDCEIGQCISRSRARFVVFNKQVNAARTVCSLCAATLTGLNINTLGLCETYVKEVKSHFQSLRAMSGLQSPHHYSHKNMTGYLSMNIGDQHVYISEFNGGRYMLSINRQTISPNIKYKAFNSQKRVAEFAIETVNNRYKSRLINYIYHGTPFTMP